MSATVVGAQADDRPMPALSNRISSRCPARASHSTGIPVVECAREVLKEKRRMPGAAAEAAVGVAFAALHLEKLCTDTA